ncbi:hypothetical protein MGH68_11675 [Erysipelothrix sp. D19-032]
MIVALVSVKIFAWVHHKGWIIKLPEGVPPAVMESFAALIPSAFVFVIFFLTRIGFSATSFQYAHVFIYKVLQAPLMGFGEFKAFDVIYQFLSNLFGSLVLMVQIVTNTVFRPIHEAMTLANLSHLKRDNHCNISLPDHLEISSQTLVVVVQPYHSLLL